jgi:hypothetical protein
MPNPAYMTDSNKFVSCIANNTATQELYLDTAAELSKIDRKNHKQVTDKGVPLVYDLMVSVTIPEKKGLGNDDLPDLLGSFTIKTAPLNWQTRNSVRMAHFTREDLRKEAGVKKGSIGRYARNLRCNLDSNMYDVTYDPGEAIGTPTMPQPTVQRIYAMSDIRFDGPLTSGGRAGIVFDGGTWDYTQVAQVESGDANTANPFFLNVAGSHSATAPGPYSYIGMIKAYNQRRQTTLDDSTLTSGGDTQFINNDSPFFRIPEQDVSEDEYVQITLDEQDNPPYDRSISGDAVELQPADFFQLTTYQSTHTFRVQAPLGLLKFELTDLLGSSSSQALRQFVAFEIECLGTYEM